MEFDKLFNPTQPVTRCGVQKWKPPHADCYKINVDASFNLEMGKGGWGFIACDCNGRFLEGAAGNIIRAASALQAEALGILRSIERVAELGMTRIMIETDAEILGRALTSEEYDGSSDGGLFRQIREFMSLQFVFCSVSVCPGCVTGS